jgi:hypothetical protein
MLLLAGCGRLGFGPLSGGDDVDPGDDDGDGGTSTGDGGQRDAAIDAFTVTGCGATTIINDDFADSATGSQWTVVNTSTYVVTEATEAVTVTFPATAPSSTRAGYRQAASVSFINTCAIAEIISVPSGSPNAYAYLRLGTPTLHVELVIENGMVIGRFDTGAQSGTSGSVAYNASNHRFLRIRHNGSNYNFEVAAAFAGPYSLLGSIGGAIIAPVSPSSLEIGGATTATNASGAGNVKFERLVFLGP